MCLRPWHTNLGTLLLALAGLCPVPAKAQVVVDPHAIYEKHCIRCHSQHGADLARLRMRVVDGKLLVRRSSGSMDKLLRNHQGVKLTDAEQEGLLTLFVSGIKWDGVYQHRCAGCHGPAVSFARGKLAFDGDKIVTIAAGRNVAEMLNSHGQATAEETTLLLDMLRFQLETGPR
jgi:mono/diheme cytochrome c family protein